MEAAPEMLFIAISRGKYPKEETPRRAFGGTVKLKQPLSPAIVPCWVPTIHTLAKGIGSPLRASTTQASKGCVCAAWPTRGQSKTRATSKHRKTRTFDFLIPFNDLILLLQQPIKPLDSNANIIELKQDQNLFDVSYRPPAYSQIIHPGIKTEHKEHKKENALQVTGAHCRIQVKPGNFAKAGKGHQVA